MDENIMNQIDEEVVSTESDKVIAGLAIVGAAAILGAAGFGAYKLSKKIVDKVWNWSQKKTTIKIEEGE